MVDIEVNDSMKFIRRLLIEKTDSGFIQFIRYFFVGGIAAVVNIGTLFLMVDIFKVNYIFSNIIGFIFGIIVNYNLSKMFVFTDNEDINKIFEIIMYVIIGILGLCFDTFMLWIFTSKIGIYYMISKIISTILIFVWNFVARKILYKLF